MIRILTAAPASGSGKTAVTCGLLAALNERGKSPCAVKCGPDYIDPMFHRAVLGVESHNLDLYFTEEARAKALFARWTAGHESVVCESAMGFYDGVGGSTPQASGWHCAEVLKLPVLLILRPKGSSLTLAAQVKGLLSFRQNSHIAAILLNDCKPMLAASLAPMLERETGIPVIGFLPPMPEAAFESRHLGLYTAAEVDGLSQRIQAIAQQLECTADLDRLFALCEGTVPTDVPTQTTPQQVRIALAQDEAFCFTYAETLETLADCGGSVVPFSPVHDRKLPQNIDGLYLPGGYPELYAEALAENKEMQKSIRQAVTAGMPTVAECGGFLYLGETLMGTDGLSHKMCGVFRGAAKDAGHLVRFGYGQLTAETDSLLFRCGESIPAHEFHYFDSTENGASLRFIKPVSGRQWQCAVTTERLYAGFPHLYFAGTPWLAKRFVSAAANYRRNKP